MRQLLLSLVVSVVVGASTSLQAQTATPVSPSEPEVAVMAPDTVEARVHDVAREIRCVVCKNQSIAESDAGLAKDLVNLVRERIEAGDSNAEAKAYIVERYGEFVLLRPSVSARNALLWGLPAAVLVLGLGGAFWFVAGRKSGASPVSALSPEERAELNGYLSVTDRTDS